MLVLPRTFASLLIALAILSSTSLARSNGRFPEAQQIASVPGGDGSVLFLRATFGVLVSRDAGATWRWICERALGYEGEWDPPIAVTRDGRLWVGLERGLVSTLDGCDVSVSTELAGSTVRDLTTDATGETLWAVTGAPKERGALWRLRLPREGLAPDAGAPRWERTGELPEGLYPMTLEVAPSRPSRIYVTAQPWATLRGMLYRTDDAGKTFAPGVGGDKGLAGDGPLFIAAIDRTDPDRALLRHLHGGGSEVVLTTDGGKTLSTVLSMKSGMYGFAKSDDGLVYYAGSGLPEHGIYRSTDRGAHFERIGAHGTLCLHAASGGRLLACQGGVEGGQVVSVSTDGGKTLTPLLRFAEVLGPQQCPGRAALCDDAWPETRALLLPRPVASTEPGRPDGGTRRRRVRDAGAETREDHEAPPPPRSRCGCVVVGARAAEDRALLTVGALALGVWGRRRTRTWIRR